MLNTKDTYSIIDYRGLEEQENSFGVLVNRWRIFIKPIILSVNKTMKIVQAIVRLHEVAKSETSVRFDLQINKINKINK